MSETSINSWGIPPIWTSQFTIPDQKNSDVSMFDNAPNDVTIWSFFGKIFIWWIVWVCVAALLFATFALWGISNVEEWTVNPILWVLLPVMWFVASFVWNLALAWLYNLFFSKRYYNFSKMFGLNFVSALLILPVFIVISAVYWFLFNANMETLYFILKLQIVFSLFISLNMMDFLSKPNYSASSLMWNTLWAALALVVALLITGNTVLVTVSAITTYALTVFGGVLWDAIYYKFYEWGNNPFYLPSLNVDIK